MTDRQHVHTVRDSAGSCELELGCARVSGSAWALSSFLFYCLYTISPTLSRNLDPNVFWRYYYTLGAHLTRVQGTMLQVWGQGCSHPGHHLQWSIRELQAGLGLDTQTRSPPLGNTATGTGQGLACTVDTKQQCQHGTGSLTGPCVLRNNTDAVIFSPEPKVLSSFKPGPHISVTGAI